MYTSPRRIWRNTMWLKKGVYVLCCQNKMLAYCKTESLRCRDSMLHLSRLMGAMFLECDEHGTSIMTKVGLISYLVYEYFRVCRLLDRLQYVLREKKAMILKSFITLDRMLWAKNIDLNVLVVHHDTWYCHGLPIQHFVHVLFCHLINRHAGWNTSTFTLLAMGGLHAH